MAAADPVGNVANAATDTANGIIGTGKNIISGTFRYVVKPAATTYGILALYSGLDGGVSALANLGAEGASRMDMLKVPLEGLTELTEDAANIAESISSWGTEAANDPIFDAPEAS
ncbi:MAG: hypothetical protein ACRBDL_04315 [Alphaproteobacteria bacterium]